ncbi:Riboflavin transporter PnuX [Actinokineospora spheciospongiae]|uniref:Riboflavin transporter PnuX n=1 Tax=Actinokineospora spheciospongiae TaxID=909613 RepID=W7J5S1_9PSEU|nr:nicotinamide riboside transporter PnuC [Actinokineospora spheciospongiae]EWC61439.1 Riboflavin transporter PnuX [Actinokineospora spheciospongiae]PWW58301.1 nicotinamide mononucleotide transporter [Actinokineospora spheciospongiae]
MHVLVDYGVTVFGQRIAWAELIGQVFALAVVFLAQRRTLWTWPVQLVSVVLLFTVYLSAHLGGLAVRQVAVGLIAVYGWWAWARRRDPVFGVAVRRASRWELVATAAAFVVGTVVFALVLDALDASWAPWPDSAIFIGTVLAFALQAYGLVEFWVVWLVVDAIGVPLQLSSGLVFSASVYIVFAGLVVYGWVSWFRSARQQATVAV